MLMWSGLIPNEPAMSATRREHVESTAHEKGRRDDQRQRALAGGCTRAPRLAQVGQLAIHASSGALVNASRASLQEARR